MSADGGPLSAKLPTHVTHSAGTAHVHLPSHTCCRGEIGKGSGRKKACAKTANALVKAALEGGTHDNVTVLVVDLRQ